MGGGVKIPPAVPEPTQNSVNDPSDSSSGSQQRSRALVGRKCYESEHGIPIRDGIMCSLGPFQDRRIDPGSHGT